MTLNPFFQQGSKSEQNLLQSLVNEQLKMYGVEVYYLPRRYMNTDKIIREVLLSEFKDAYPIEAYVENYEGFEGQGDLMTKFGVRITDQLNLIISKDRYQTYIEPLMAKLPSSESKLITRPKEGDLIWFPLSDTIFQIMFVEHEKYFYQLKENYVYELKCEIFEYDDEVIDTGIEVIDDNAEDDGYILTLNLAGIGSTATATTGISTGSVTQLFLQDQGYQYSRSPIVAITSAPDGGIDATAVAITTQSQDRQYYAIDELRIINPGAGYTQPPVVRFIDPTGSGAIATAGISTLSSIGFVTVTSGGDEYAIAPTVTFSSPPGTGTTATGIAKIVSNTVTQIQITNAGAGYTENPTITISSPASSGVGTGNYKLNEIVTGEDSGTQARVKSWNSTELELNVGMITGTFVTGEKIIGSGTTITEYIYGVDDTISGVVTLSNDPVIINSGVTVTVSQGSTLIIKPEVTQANYILVSTGSSVEGSSEMNEISPYDSNISFEEQGINIIDFTETNPFGTF